MLNDSHPNRYEFRSIGNEHNSYYFTTANDITYEIKFVPSAYLFEDFVDHHVDACEMIIAVADNPTGGRLLFDSLIKPTIRAIFYDFFRSNEQVIIFICDSSDGRQLARMRKFTDWYYKDMQIGFLKLDVKIPDPNGIIYISAILKVHNTRFSVFVDVFQSLGLAGK